MGQTSEFAASLLIVLQPPRKILYLKSLRHELLTITCGPIFTKSAGSIRC